MKKIIGVASIFVATVFLFSCLRAIEDPPSHAPFT